MSSEITSLGDRPPCESNQNQACYVMVLPLYFNKDKPQHYILIAEIDHKIAAQCWYQLYEQSIDNVSDLFWYMTWSVFTIYNLLSSPTSINLI